LFFNHQRDAKITICLSLTPELLRAVDRLPDSMGQRIRHSIRRKKRSIFLSFAAAFAVLIVLGLGGYLLLIEAVDVAATAIPAGVEEKIGNIALESLIQDPNRYRDTEAQQMLESLLAFMRPGLPPEYQKLKIYIQKDDEINAFALPGGHIVFNTQLLEKARTPEEILGVAAHEMAHVTERHGLKSLLRSASLYLVLTFMIGDFTGLIAIIAENSSFLVNQTFSRAAEQEADEWAFALLWKRGIDPRGIAGFFDLIKIEEEKRFKNYPEIKKVLGYLSTHPDTDDRIQAIHDQWQQHVSEQGSSHIRPVAFDMARLQAALKKL
jgi:predicted Zn-dependent protease